MGHEIYYRMDEFGPYTLNPSAGNLPGGVVFEGYGAGRCNCTFTHAVYLCALAPGWGRLGRWLPNTVVRAGWGLVYGQLSGYSYVTNQCGAGTVGIGWNILTFNSPAYGQAGRDAGPGIAVQSRVAHRIEPEPGNSADSRHVDGAAVLLRPQRRAASQSQRVEHGRAAPGHPATSWWKPTGWAIAARGKPPAARTALNYITPQILAAHGLSLGASNLTSLLTSPASSPQAVAAGIHRALRRLPHERERHAGPSAVSACTAAT